MLIQVVNNGILLSSGSGAGPHPELPQGQMDSLLSIISSQRERFRSRNQELEIVSHHLSHAFTVFLALFFFFLFSIPHLIASSRIPLQENRSMQQTMQALQNELDSLRADNIKLYEKIKFLQGYAGRVRRRVCSDLNVNAVNVCDDLVSDVWLMIFSSLQAGGSDDTVMRYSSQYEERLDPFASFSRKVKSSLKPPAVT